MALGNLCYVKAFKKVVGNKKKLAYSEVVSGSLNSTQNALFTKKSTSEGNNQNINELVYQFTNLVSKINNELTNPKELINRLANTINLHMKSENIKSNNVINKQQ